MQGKLSRTITKKLSGRIFKIFFTEGYIVYSRPREKHPVTGGVPIEARESRSNAPCPPAHVPWTVINLG